MTDIQNVWHTTNNLRPTWSKNPQTFSSLTSLHLINQLQHGDCACVRLYCAFWLTFITPAAWHIAGHFGDDVVHVWWPNQQCQSTEVGWLVIQTGLSRIVTRVPQVGGTNCKNDNLTKTIWSPFTNNDRLQTTKLCKSHPSSHPAEYAAITSD